MAVCVFFILESTAEFVALGWDLNFESYDSTVCFLDPNLSQASGSSVLSPSDLDCEILLDIEHALKGPLLRQS